MSDEKTYEQMRNEFQLKYKNELFPKLSGFEKERKITFITTMIVFGIIFILGVIFLIFNINALIENSNKNLMDEEYFNWMFALNIGVFIVAFTFYAWRKKDFEITLKYEIMPIVCSCLGNLEWRAHDIYLTFLYAEANLIPKNIDLSEEKYDDCFAGIYKNVEIRIQECKFTTGDGRDKKTVFKGVIISFSMNKTFLGNTVIKADSVFHLSPDTNLKHTVLEDVEFEKKYDVFTDDEVEARYLITPSFMERLNNIKLAFKADKISASFYKDKFFIALHTNKDLFSIGSLVKPAYDPKQIFQMFEEMMSIYKLIDHFKLAQKIGL